MADGSVSKWISELKDGDDEAARRIWERYFARLINLARNNLRGVSRRVADEDDAVISAFDSFCRRVRAGRFPDLSDRNELWGLLVSITIRKAQNQAAFLNCAKRGGGGVRGDSAFDDSASSGATTGMAAIPDKEPTPELAAMVAEEIQHLIECLGDNLLRRIAYWKMEGLTHTEIADRLNCSARTVARKMCLIRQKLKLQEKS